MSEPTTALGYVILYVEEVASSLDFYERAFELARRFFHDEDGSAYGELETGATRLAFASLKLARAQLNRDVVAASLENAPLGFEIALVVTDVQAMYARAVAAGAVPISEPATKPWGQKVAYVQDGSGHLVELCTPMP